MGISVVRTRVFCNHIVFFLNNQGVKQVQSLKKADSFLRLTQSDMPEDLLSHPEEIKSKIELSHSNNTVHNFLAAFCSFNHTDAYFISQ